MITREVYQHTQFRVEYDVMIRLLHTSSVFHNVFYHISWQLISSVQLETHTCVTCSLSHVLATPFVLVFPLYHKEIQVWYKGFTVAFCDNQLENCFYIVFPKQNLLKMAYVIKYSSNLIYQPFIFNLKIRFAILFRKKNRYIIRAVDNTITISSIISI